MDDGILNETNSWIQAVMQWQTQEDFRAVVETSKCLHDLKCYLEKVIEQLQMVNYDELFASRLLVLLSKLTERNIFLLDRDLARSLVQCLFHFISAVKSNAKSLALFQLSKSMNRDTKALEIEKLLGFIGVSSKDFERTYIKELSDFIRAQTHLCPPHQTPDDLHSDVIRVCAASLVWDDFLVSLGQLCFHLRHEHEFLPLLEAILLYLIHRRRSDLRVKALAEEIGHQLSAEGNVSYYGCLVILWTNYLPLLEEEVLNLIQNVTKKIKFGSQKKLVQHSANLIKACQNHLDIHVAVYSMLRKLCVGSQGHAAVTWTLSSLSKAIWSQMNHLQIESHCSCYPLTYRSLIKFLILDPFGMSVPAVTVRLQHLVTLIDDLLCGVENSSTVVSDIGWILAEFPLWCRAALLIYFHVDDQIASSLLRLIGWHSGLYYVTGASFAKLHEITSALKTLIVRSSKNIIDDSSTIRLMIEELPMMQMKNIVRRLVLVFCLRLDSSELKKKKGFLCLAYGETHMEFCLQDMADWLELCVNYPSSWIEEVSCQKENIVKLFELICQTNPSKESMKSRDWLLNRVAVLSEETSY